MPRDIYLDDSWNTVWASTGDIKTVSGQPQRAQQVATLAFNAARKHLGGAIHQEVVIEMQSDIRDNLLAADAVDAVRSIDVIDVTDESLSIDVTTDVAEVTIPFNLNRP